MNVIGRQPGHGGQAFDLAAVEWEHEDTVRVAAEIIATIVNAGGAAKPHACADCEIGTGFARIEMGDGDLCRKLEVTSLTWTSLRIVGEEYHFEIVGKWGVERWFRVPKALYHELLEHKTSSPYVFAAYNEQLRRFHAHNPNWLRIVNDEFSPNRFGRWFYERVTEWAASNPKGDAFVHVFRKTTLQHARRGEDINRQVAKDAKVSESVMMTNYVKEMDEELRAGSNRTFHRILASLSPEVAKRYGYVEVVVDSRERQFQAATAAKNWPLAAELAARLAAEGNAIDEGPRRASASVQP